MNDQKSGRDDPRFLHIDSLDQYYDKDLARTYGFTESSGISSLDPVRFEREQEQLRRDGFLFLESLVDEEQLDALRADATPHLSKMGRNSFEGERTQRIYGVPAKFRSGDCFIEHPHILAHLDRLLLPNYLLSQTQVINILTDSPAQRLHVDDGFYPWPRPRPAISIATIFAIDDFTEDNGATVVIPGSHLWGSDRSPLSSDRRVKAVMPAGSCILFAGSLWHGGGENSSGDQRMALTCQYCEPWARTQENYFLSVSPETAASVSENLRRMLGYSIHPPFMGMSDGMHPKRKLPLPQREEPAGS